MVNILIIYMYESSFNTYLYMCGGSCACQSLCRRLKVLDQARLLLRSTLIRAIIVSPIYVSRYYSREATLPFIVLASFSRVNSDVMSHQHVGHMETGAQFKVLSVGIQPGLYL